MKDALGSIRSAVVFGAASDVAKATVRLLVADRAREFVLAARKPDRLEPFAAELRARGARVHLVEFDADEPDTHEEVVGEAFAQAGEVDLVLMAFGVLPDQALAERDARAALSAIQTNFLGAVSAIIPVANRMRAQGHGTIAVLSSVAGERGRRTNFVYGSSKAGLDTFCQGLGDALTGSGVHMLVVRPGFIHSKMTRGLKAPPLATSPDAVARAIVEAARSGADTVWVPPAIRWVMSALRHLPRAVFRRLEV